MNLSSRPTIEQGPAASEARLRQAFENASAVVCAKDRRGRYLFVNRAFEQVAQRTAGEIVGRTDEEIFPAALATRFRHNDLRVLHECRALEFEETVSDGASARTYLSSKFPLLDADGSPQAVCVIATDITERKRLEQALSSAALAVSTSESETLFRELVRYLATILGVDGAFIAVPEPQSSGMLRMLAFNLEQTTRENFSYPLSGTPCSTVLGQCFRYYPAGLVEAFPTDAGFRALGIESYAGQPLTSTSGRPLGLIAAFSRRPLERPDFVESVLRIFAVRVVAELERLEAAERLRESETSYREIFEASEDSIVVHDWDTAAIVDANPKACATYGYSREELLRKHVGDLGSGEPPYTREEALRWIDQARRLGTARFEWRRRNRDGSLHWDEVCLRSATIGGRPRVLAFSRDVTDRKRREQQLRQAQRMEAIGQLTGGIAHDFNNLLTSIMGYVGLARERPNTRDDPRLAGYLEQSQRSCERARDLVRQMLLFSRGPRGDSRPVALVPLLEQALEAVRVALPATVRLTADVAANRMAASLDPLQFERVLLNLCLNASDAMDGTGTLQVGLRPVSLEQAVCSACRGVARGEFVELSVADDGVGMSAQTIERIFEPFFSTKDPGKGTGMGLATVHGILHEHGGHVLVESVLGSGSTFRVLFPALPDVPAAAEDATGRPAAVHPVATRLRGTVLLIDDLIAVGEFMAELLATWGLEVVYQQSPERALDLVRGEPRRFDVVLTDQAMGALSGLRLAVELRKVRDDLPVVLYSGDSTAIDPGDVSSAGIAAVLDKPVDPKALEAVLRRCLQRAAS